ncbi:MAG: 4-hydroxy-3-methylbut-2-enyl diphosphate reductase [Pseudomonadota bacterium]
MQLTLASPRGFCAGVDRAIEIVNRALELFGAPVYVRHEVVHNKSVVDDLKKRGAIFIEQVSEAPDNCILIFSAHGVSQQVRAEANSRELKLFDATCPLVTKVHLEVARYSQQGINCILIGHKGHAEVEGTLGQYDNSYGGNIYLVECVADIAKLDIDRHAALAFVSQTTLSMDDTQAIIYSLKQYFPQIKGPKKDDICYATQNRQDAVKQISQQAQLVFIVGSQNSSNSNRLKEVAMRNGVKNAYLIDNASEVQEKWLTNITSVGLSAGASAPEYLVDEVKQRLSELGINSIVDSAQSEDVIKEDIIFPLPKVLQVKKES